MRTVLPDVWSWQWVATPQPVAMLMNSPLRCKDKRAGMSMGDEPRTDRDFHFVPVRHRGWAQVQLHGAAVSGEAQRVLQKQHGRPSRGGHNGATLATGP